MSDCITFLRKYGPIPQNDNMYDESIQRASKRLKFDPITFESPYLEKLQNNLASDTPHSIILTGTAGDGKTYLCRKIWEYLGGDSDEWSSEKKIRRLSLNNGKELVVIKDSSELRKSENIKKIREQHEIREKHFRNKRGKQSLSRFWQGWRKRSIGLGRV